MYGSNLLKLFEIMTTRHTLSYKKLFIFGLKNILEQKNTLLIFLQNCVWIKMLKIVMCIFYVIAQ